MLRNFEATTELNITTESPYTAVGRFTWVIKRRRREEGEQNSRCVAERATRDAAASLSSLLSLSESPLSLYSLADYAGRSVPLINQIVPRLHVLQVDNLVGNLRK